MPHRTPLYDWHVAHGARMVDFAGWDMPVQYTSIVEEHQAVRTAAGLFDISHMGRLVFEGPDAPDFLTSIYTNDVASMRQGQVRYGLICNERGGILDDVLVYRFEPFWLMVVNASNRDKILAWIEQHRGQRQLRVTDKTFDWAMIAIQGPRAGGVLQLPSLGIRAFTYSQTSWEAPRQPKFYHAFLVTHFQEPSPHYIISRTGYTGEDGYEFIVPRDAVGSCVEELAQTLKGQGTDLKPCGLGARDTLRLEAAMPLYGHELNEDTDPFQAGLAWAVKLDKGDFIGREALVRRRQDSSLLQRVGLELEGKRIAREGAAE
jgi:aminomethyltransferase